MLKVSVIIPVYNAKDYLERCLDSVCNQTLKDIEIICVNDASTDNSIEILNAYAKKFSNMHIIDCATNGGESVARNKGLDKATGEYIAFVDNDDEIDLDFYEKLYNEAIKTNADIAKGEVRITGYDKSVTCGNLNTLIRENNYNPLYFFYDWWTAIYKRSIIEENNIKLIEGYMLGGDLLFLNQFTTKASSIALVDDVYYYYHKRENSGSSKILSYEKIDSVFKVHVMILENTLKLNQSDGKDDLLKWCLGYCFFIMGRVGTKESIYLAVKNTFEIYKNISLSEKLIESLESTSPHQMKFLKENDVNAMIEFYTIKLLPKTLSQRLKTALLDGGKNKYDKNYIGYTLLEKIFSIKYKTFSHGKRYKIITIIGIKIKIRIENNEEINV